MVSVAIDGPAGAGKSTLARRLAAELGYIYVDTGAMYRAIGLYALRAGKDPKDNAAVDALLPQIELRLASIAGEQHIYLKDEDVSAAIRTEAAGMAASAVGANPAVRAFLLDLQRSMAKKQDVLMDGRDIGTVVLPDATVKIFLTASPEARATRRWKEYQAKGIDTPYEEVLADVKQRDYQDTHRAAAPLKQAEDAVLLDTSALDTPALALANAARETLRIGDATEFEFILSDQTNALAEGFIHQRNGQHVVTGFGQRVGDLRHQAVGRLHFRRLIERRQHQDGPGAALAKCAVVVAGLGGAAG